METKIGLLSQIQHPVYTYNTRKIQIMKALSKWYVLSFITTHIAHFHAVTAHYLSKDLIKLTMRSTIWASKAGPSIWK